MTEVAVLDVTLYDSHPVDFLTSILTIHKLFHDPSAATGHLFFSASGGSVLLRASKPCLGSVETTVERV